MRNIKLTIAYNGFKYAGWQTQNCPRSIVHGPCKTIQGEIEKALYKIFKKRIALIGSGRTDSGVHAVRQVANFKVDSVLPLGKIKNALNGILPQDIVILHAEEAALSFHSRFDVKSKIYRYVIVNQAQKPVFVRRFAHWVRTPLNIGMMLREAKFLLGRHDFRSFQAADRVERGSIATVESVIVRKIGGNEGFFFLENRNLVFIDIKAKGFLRNMVRNIVGTLIEAGRGRIAKGGFKDILRKRDRAVAGPCAPAYGLYLLDVRYE